MCPSLRRFIKSAIGMCTAIVILIAGCTQSSDESTDSAEPADPKQAQMQTYLPFALKLDEIITAAYEPGPVGFEDYERLVQELDDAADARQPFDEAAGPTFLALEKQVAEVLDAHHSTLTAARNFQNRTELIAKYQAGEEIEGNPELTEAVELAFPDGPPPPDQVTPFDKYDARTSLIDVKWKHVEKTRVLTEKFVREYKDIERSLGVPM